MDRYILTIDVGTTAIKTSVFDEKLSCICSATTSYVLDTGKNGQIEFQPERYWELTGETVQKMFHGFEELRDQICAIVPTTQGETIIPVDANGNALRNAIVWLDGRAEQQAAALSPQFPPEKLYARTGVSELAGTVPVCKAMWIRDHEPEVFSQTAKFLLLADWIILKLSGKFATDHVLLSSSGYYDIISNCYYREILDVAGLRYDQFPDVYDPGTKIGTILPEAAQFLGISASTEILTGAMDQPLAALAAGNDHEGIITETTGTCLVVGATSYQPNFNNPYRSVIYRHVISNAYLVIPVCMTAGIVLKWFLEQFENAEELGDQPFDAMCQQAAGIAPGADGLIMLPFFTGIQTPEINPDASGVLFGLDLSMGKAHCIRAILEAVGYMLKENLEIVQEITGCHADQIRSLGGGAKNDIWLQIKADICQKRVSRMVHTECTSLGAAIVGAVSMGWFASYSEAISCANRDQNIFEPNPDYNQVYTQRYAKYRQLYKALKPVFYPHSQI